MQDLERFLQSEQRLRELRVVKNDKAGLVEEIVLRSGRKSSTISGKKLYSLLDEVKSYCFTIRRRGSKLTISGRGYGHHMGLCQWGARQMVSDGWDYQSILQFYYPGTKRMKLA
jgi:stage II sporulation protein D